jgi:8-oxo-dGTP pyrophosphatase MutT (NUDIX family)
VDKGASFSQYFRPATRCLPAALFSRYCDRWEDGLVERVQATPSGTVVVVRDASEGLELLMLQRSTRKADYFSGAWVFPGGKVEPSDLGDDELSRARSAAVREANEEAGLHLEPSHVLPLNRWEPEPSARQPRPFSAWIFLCVSDQTPVIDDHEIVDIAWMRPSDCLRLENPNAFTRALEKKTAQNCCYGMVTNSLTAHPGVGTERGWNLACGATNAIRKPRPHGRGLLEFRVQDERPRSESQPPWPPLAMPGWTQRCEGQRT